MLLTVPTILTGIAMHSTTSAGIGVQLNWSTMKAIKIVQSATVDSKDPAMITRYLPIQVSPNQPATGISIGNKMPQTIVKPNCTSFGTGSSEIAPNVQYRAKYNSIPHTSTSRVPREKEHWLAEVILKGMIAQLSRMGRVLHCPTTYVR